MTRKDYKRIAKAFSETKPDPEGDQYILAFKIRSKQWKQMVSFMADQLIEDNPRFDRDRFYIACGYYELD